MRIGCYNIGVKEVMCGLIDVYADLLFLVDFCMDLACISVCARICGAHVGKRRLFFAAAIGGIYSVLSLFVGDGVISVVCALAAWQIICLIAFYRRKDSPSRQLKLSLCYLAVNALLGGGVSAVFGLLGRLSEVRLPSVEYGYANKTRRLIFLSLAASCLLVYLLVTRMREVRLDKPEYVKITEFGGSVTLRAICDTGNLLSDPLTGAPCTVISREDLIALGGVSLLYLLDKNSDNDRVLQNVRIALIPAKTVSGDVIMPAFFTSVELLDSEKKTIRKCKSAIAVSNTDAPAKGSAILPGCFCR